MTTSKLATVGDILVEEFMRPMGLTQAALSELMGFSASKSTNSATTAET